MRTTPHWLAAFLAVGLGTLWCAAAQEGGYRKTYNYGPGGQRESVTSTQDGKTTKTLYFYGPLNRLEKTVTVELDPQAGGEVLMLAGTVSKDKNRYYLASADGGKIELTGCPPELLTALQAKVGKPVQVAVQATVTETKGVKQTKVARTLAIHAP